MQIANRLDKVTQEKILRSILLGASGFLLAIIPILSADPQVIAFLKDHMIVGAAVASFVPVIINSINQWRKGVEDPTNPKV